MRNLSFLSNAHPSYIEKLYMDFQNSPESVQSEWKHFFQGFEMGLSQIEASNEPSKDSSLIIEKELAIYSLINAYRSRAHLISDTNPIRTRKDRNAGLEIHHFQLEQMDLDYVPKVGSEIGALGSNVKEIIDKLNIIYCGKIGFEFSHIEDLNKRNWIQNKIENRNLSSDYGLNVSEKRRILEKLNGAVIFEKFLHTKYVGQKRFSLEGGESTIAALDAMIQLGSEMGVEEVIIGMAHRGRLNVLANIMAKTYEQIFSEFEGTAVPDLSFGSGDVKYHLGYSSMITSLGGKKVFLRLAPNPSHLEAVNPVVEGLSRAKADQVYHSDYDKILPILIHGDAAIAGQGIVYEILQMSQLNGYYTGGTVHFVINNQIGFTTDFEDARSSTYSTSIASLLHAPVFHVNGDDAEAVVFAAKLAIEYRQEFNCDVFIDMVCYRRHGHNEGDDPKFTQPTMYSIISKHPNVRDLYINSLQAREEIEKKLASELEAEFWNTLQLRLDMIKQNPLPYQYQEPELAWKELKNKNKENWSSNPNTNISKEKLELLINKIYSSPAEFNVLPKISRLISSAQKLFESNYLDWSMAELLAYASILEEGMNVRMSGQDVKRGTFSHRHAVLFDEVNNSEYNRLSNISNTQGKFFIYNSFLSEFAVLGFEYGYSLASPNHLIIWEAQFGDFVNGAQVIFDQFISTAEVKWNRMSNLVLLLPHGYDGQGPEHSSARLERFLQAAAEKNIIVANVSTPANFFHLLRRQVKAAFRKPLIVMSPKSLLRHPKCISSVEEFTKQQEFQEYILNYNSSVDCRKLIMCSGQIYYDLLQRKEELKAEDIAILRIEQLYPIVEEKIIKILQAFKNVKTYWVQEEPLNMGATPYLKQNWNYCKLEYIGRPASAATAVGYKSVHDQQLKQILVEAFM